jgi:hypothetical protein
MTVLNFPDDPAAVGNIYVAPNGVTYYYDGVKWIGENSVNTLNDRITAGDKNLIINTDGNITFPDGFIIDTSTYTNTTMLFGAPNGEISTKNIVLSTGEITNTISIPGTVFDVATGDGNTDPVSISGKNGVGITTGADGLGYPQNHWTFGTDGQLTFPQGTTIGTADGGEFLINGAVDKDVYIYTYGNDVPNGWTFDTNGNLTLPSDGNIRSQPSSNISIDSDQYADIAWYNPAIFDPDTSNFDNLNAGDGLGNFVGVDQTGAYFSVIVANTDGATSGTLNTWGVNTDGNLFTERFTQSNEGTVELPPGDIIDFEGNSLVYVPTTNTAPPHDHNGLLWFNTEDGRAYIRYNHQWVDANPPVVAPASAYLDGLVIEGQTISSIDYVESAVKIGGDLVPDEDLTYNLGSPTKQWKHLYVDSHTIYMGGKAVSLTDQGLTVDGRTAIYEIDGGVASTWLTV